MAYPVIPENKSVGNLRKPPTADSMAITKQNRGGKIDGSYKPYVSRTCPTAKWVGQNGQPYFVVTSTSTGSPSASINFIDGSRRTRASLALLGTGIDRNNDYSLLRFTCKAETAGTFIHNSCQCVDGLQNPPNDSFFGSVMIGDLPYDNEDIGANKGPYYLTFESSFPPSAGYSPSILVYPNQMKNGDISKMVSPYVIWFNGKRVIKHDTVVSDYPEYKRVAVEIRRASKGTRRIYQKYMSSIPGADVDRVLPGDKCTKVIRKYGVGYGAAGDRSIWAEPGNVGMDWVDHFSVASGGSFIVEYSGLMAANASSTKWPVHDQVNQMKRVKLDALTMNVCYIPSRTMNNGTDPGVWTSSTEACVFDIKADNSTVEIHIPNALFITGIRASKQHIYLCNIRGSNNKIFIHIGRGLTFFGGEEASNLVFWYAGLSSNNTNEIIFVKDGNDMQNAFKFEGKMPVQCRALYPISKLKNPESSRAYGCWWEPNSRLTTEGSNEWNSSTYASIINPL